MKNILEFKNFIGSADSINESYEPDYKALADQLEKSMSGLGGSRVISSEDGNGQSISSHSIGESADQHLLVFNHSLTSTENNYQQTHKHEEPNRILEFHER